MEFELVKIYIDDAELGIALLDGLEKLGYDENTIKAELQNPLRKNAEVDAVLFLESDPRIMKSSHKWADENELAWNYRTIDLRGIKKKR